MLLRLAPTIAGTRLRVMCFASNSGAPSGEQLCSQIDQLRAEADATKAKASNARLRLMRLSEAAERLKRQAAVCVQSGKENEARELLFQKKKVMQALEKSKSRIQWLDELSAKLNQAISVKESQLIVNISSGHVNGEDDSGPVHIVSPRKAGVDDKDDHKDIVSDSLKLVNDQNLPSSTESEPSPPEDLEFYGAAVNDLSFYDDFLEHIDEQLNKIEAELVNVLDVSSLILNDEEKSRNSKVNEITELLEGIRSIRQRISSVMWIKMETN